MESKAKEMKDLRYRDKEWLFNQIEVLGKSQSQVAKECGVSHATICNWFRDRKQKRSEYYFNNKEKINNQHKEYNILNRGKIKINKKEYAIINKEKIKETKKKYYKENSESLKLYQKEHSKELKKLALDILGGCKCAICGDEELIHLTIDHIDETGYLDKKLGFKKGRLYSKIVNEKYPIEKLSNLRVLCWNCNDGRRRFYYNIPKEK